MKLRIALLCVACLAGSAWADVIDDAEAKKRGVSVEVVQLEKSQARVKELEKEVADLKAKLVAATKPATSVVAQATDAPVKKGMKKADVPAKFTTVETDNDTEIMEWVEIKSEGTPLPPTSPLATRTATKPASPARSNGSGRSGPVLTVPYTPGPDVEIITTWRITLTNGIVTDVHSETTKKVTPYRTAPTETIH